MGILQRMFLIAGLSLMAVSPASAQLPVPEGIGQPTSSTFQRLDQSLSALLASGWAVTAVSGADGNVMILNKGPSWVRCELFGLEQTGLRLSLQKQVGSICQKLD